MGGCRVKTDFRISSCWKVLETVETVMHNLIRYQFIKYSNALFLEIKFLPHCAQRL